MIQADQFFNEPILNSSIVVPKAHQMLKQWRRCSAEAYSRKEYSTVECCEREIL